MYATESAGTAKNTVMNYVVPDVRATVALLRGCGVEFEAYDFGDFNYYLISRLAFKYP